MKCLAVAVRTGMQCKNEAEADGACREPAHKRQVAERKSAGEFNDHSNTPAAEPHDDTASGGQGREPLPPAPAGEDGAAAASIDAELAAVPALQESVIDDIAAAVGGGPAPDLATLERAARRHLETPELLEGEEDAAAIDAAAVEGAEDATTARRELRAAIKGGQVVTHGSAKRWIRILVNPMLAKQGKELLDDDEVEEGAQLAVEWLGAWSVETREGRTVMWLVTVFGLRYVDQILYVASLLGRVAVARIRSGLTGIEVPPTAPRQAPERMPSPHAAAAAADVAPAPSSNGRSSSLTTAELPLAGAGFGN